MDISTFRTKWSIRFTLSSYNFMAIVRQTPDESAVFQLFIYLFFSIDFRSRHKYINNLNALLLCNWRNDRISSGWRRNWKSVFRVSMYYCCFDIITHTRCRLSTTRISSTVRRPTNGATVKYRFIRNRDVAPYR